MKITNFIATTAEQLAALRADVIVVGVAADDLAKPPLSEQQHALIDRQVAAGNISTKAGAARLLISDNSGNGDAASHTPHLLVLGLGKWAGSGAAQRSAITTSLKTALQQLGNLALNTVAIALPAIEGADEKTLNAAALTAAAADYRFTASRSDDGKDHLNINTIAIVTRADESAALERAAGTANGMEFCKLLADLPGNICTPTYLGEQAEALAEEQTSITTTVLGEAEMAELGMGSLLSVSRGSRQEAKLIVMEYAGGDDEKPIVLVGKGLTFDAGGISIKPGAGMDEMKYDMCGGATVFGTMKAIAEMGLKRNVIGIVPSSENLPDGDANKPGDVVTSMAGKTIEILNTDAEGRLILCDALTYAERFDPELVIDMATLTGAVIIALGKKPSGLFTDDEALRDQLIAAGESTGDRLWQLPMWDEYQQQLHSNFADIANIGGREAGSITAACFLKRFTGNYRWAHIDIAGTAWVSGGKAKGATGRPMPMLIDFLCNYSNDG